MSETELKEEIARLVGVLCNIRDVVSVPDPRHKTMEWYMAIVEHVRRYVNNAFCEDLEGRQNDQYS